MLNKRVPRNDKMRNDRATAVVMMLQPRHAAALHTFDIETEAVVKGNKKPRRPCLDGETG